MALPRSFVFAENGW